MPELAQIHPMSKLPALRLLNANEWREALRLLIGVAVGMACLTQAAAGYGVIALGVAFIGLFGGLIVSPTPGRLGRRRFLSAGHSG